MPLGGWRWRCAHVSRTCPGGSAGRSGCPWRHGPAPDAGCGAA